MVVALSLALALLAPVAAAEPGEREAIGLLRVDAEGLEPSSLHQALQLRLPALQVVDHREADAALSAGQLYVQLARDGGRRLRLTLVTADGRAYDRLVDPGQDPPERVAAAMIANLVVAIEEGGLLPDRTAVEVPGEPADVSGVDVASAEGVEAAAPPSAPTPPWQLGISGAPGLLIGPGSPRGADLFAAWTGALALSLRAPRGPIARFALRGGGRRAGEYGLTRLQFGLGGGMTWRASTLEVEVAAAVTIEPWWVTRGGVREPTYRGGVARTPWLLGGELRLAAGHTFAAAGAAWRVGPWLGLAGALALDGGGGAPRVSNADGDPLFRLGAFELASGLEVVAWLDLPPRGR